MIQLLKCVKIKQYIIFLKRVGDNKSYPTLNKNYNIANLPILKDHRIINFICHCTHFKKK